MIPMLPLSWTIMIAEICNIIGAFVMCVAIALVVVYPLELADQKWRSSINRRKLEEYKSAQGGNSDE